MRFVIKLGAGSGSILEVTTNSDNPTIASILDQARKGMPDYTRRFRLETPSSKLFLAHPSGPFKLDENKNARDYKLTDGQVLWLMASAVHPKVDVPGKVE